MAEKGVRRLPTRLGKSEFEVTAVSADKAEALRESTDSLVRVIDDKVYIGPPRSAKLTKAQRYSAAASVALERPKPRIQDKSEVNTLANWKVNDMDDWLADYERNRVEPLADEWREKSKTLFRWNLAAFLLHLAIASYMFIFSNELFKISVSTSFAAGPPGCVNQGLCEQFIINNFDATIAYWVVAFSALSALFHFIAAFPLRGYYEKNIQSGKNPLRWVEYALSSTVMILILMLLSGLTALSALIGVAFANISMILFGWIMEIMNPPERSRTEWTAFVFGCIAGIGPWIALYGTLFLNLEQLGVSYTEIPSFVWAILLVQFLFFNSFAINQAWQFSSKNADAYYNGERGYIFLSWTAKTVLAIMIYVNTLVL